MNDPWNSVIIIVFIIIVRLISYYEAKIAARDRAEIWEVLDRIEDLMNRS